MVHTNLMHGIIVRLDQIFDKYNDTLFPCPGIVFHDQWGCPMTI